MSHGDARIRSVKKPPEQLKEVPALSLNRLFSIVTSLCRDRTLPGEGFCSRMVHGDHVLQTISVHVAVAHSHITIKLVITGLATAGLSLF